MGQGTVISVISAKRFKFGQKTMRRYIEQTPFFASLSSEIKWSICMRFYPFSASNITVYFSCAEEAQNRISLVTSIWASSPHFVVVVVVVLQFIVKSLGVK